MEENINNHNKLPRNEDISKERKNINENKLYKNNKNINQISTKIPKILNTNLKIFDNSLTKNEKINNLKNPKIYNIKNEEQKFKRNIIGEDSNLLDTISINKINDYDTLKVKKEFNHFNNDPYSYSNFYNNKILFFDGDKNSLILRGSSNEDIENISNRNVESKTYEYELPTINIDNNRNINFYYPYFFKNKMITYNNNYPSILLISKCNDILCELCEPNSLTCRKCKHGFYLNIDRCIDRCPINTVADIYKRTCNKIDESSIYIIFTIFFKR